jgi:hypothetical protein
VVLFLPSFPPSSRAVHVRPCPINNEYGAAPPLPAQRRQHGTEGIQRQRRQGTEKSGFTELPLFFPRKTFKTEGMPAEQYQCHKQCRSGLQHLNTLATIDNLKQVPKRNIFHVTNVQPHLRRFRSSRHTLCKQ